MNSPAAGRGKRAAAAVAAVPMAAAVGTWLTRSGVPMPTSELWTRAQPGGRSEASGQLAEAKDGNPVRHGRCLQMKRCPNCLSLWERPAAGRVRVPSAAVSATKAPSPRPSPRGRGREIDDVQKGSYISNPSAEHHCHPWPPPALAGDSESFGLRSGRFRALWGFSPYSDYAGWWSSREGMPGLVILRATGR